MNSSLYIHIPYCISKCIYCDFFSIPHEKIPDEYICALAAELEYRAKNIDYGKTITLNTIYIGGGTPSLLTADQLKKIEDVIYRNFLVSDDVEYTIEVNPDDINESFINSLKQTKVNRISCGLQSMSPEVLKFSGRRGSIDDNRRALFLLKNNWQKNFSVDIICGLPGETEVSFINGIDEICEYSPYHISMYSLTVEDETPLGRMFNSKKLEIDFDKSDLLWIKAREILKEKGFYQYEVSNFSKPGFESRHNLCYWNHLNYIGCGAGATGTVYNSDGTGVRWTNAEDVKLYSNYWNHSDFINRTENAQVNESIDIETSKFEFFMMGLRKLSGVNENEYKKIFNQEFSDSVKKYFKEWEKKGLCNIEENQYRMNSEGILFLNDFLIGFPN